jgi:Tol biopolymer transport system component
MKCHIGETEQPMVEKLSGMNEDRTNNQTIDVASLSTIQFVPALVVAILAAAVIGGYFFYQRSYASSLLFNRAATRIAFMSNRDGNWEVYVMDRDGGNLANLTNNPSADGAPVYSGGQQRLAFASDRDGERLDLFLMGLDGSDVVNITQTPDNNDVPINWSPNGEYLVFMSDQGGSTQIFLSQSNGEGLINLTERDQAQTFDDWSPSADHFLLSTASEVGISPVIADLAGGPQEPLTDGSYPAAGGRWSPDGQKVAFMAVNPQSGAIDVVVEDMATGELTNLTHSDSSDRFPRWSPDGSKIAFVSDRDGNSEIYVMNADGSNLTNLTNNPAGDSVQGDFAWSPDGTQILFHTDRDGNVEVYVMNADGSNQINLTNSPETDYSAIWVQ